MPLHRTGRLLLVAALALAHLLLRATWWTLSTAASAAPRSYSPRALRRRFFRLPRLF